MATAVAEKCKYCEGEIKRDPRRPNQVRVTCGSAECKRKHVCWLSANPRHKQAAIDPAAVLERAKPDLEKWEAEQRTCECGATFTPNVANAKRCPPCREKWAQEKGQTAEHKASRKRALDAELEAARARNGSIPPAELAAIPTHAPQQHNPAIYEGVKAANPDPILRAVEALEAVPADKWPGIFEVLQARLDAQMAAKRAEEMLASLGVA